MRYEQALYLMNVENSTIAQKQMPTLRIHSHHLNYGIDMCRLTVNSGINQRISHIILCEAITQGSIESGFRVPLPYNIVQTFLVWMNSLRLVTQISQKSIFHLKFLGEVSCEIDREEAELLPLRSVFCKLEIYLESSVNITIRGMQSIKD